MAARRALAVCASSLSKSSAMILLGCLPFTPLCGSFFLRCFSSWSCWVNCASLGPCRSWLRWLQGFSFGFSDQPILAAIPRPCAPCLCYPWLCDCSAIHPNLHRRRSRVSCVGQHRVIELID